MTALSNSLVLTKPSPLRLSSASFQLFHSFIPFPGVPSVGWTHLKCTFGCECSPLKSVDQCLGSLGPNNSSFRPIRIGKTQISTSKRALTVQAGYSAGGRAGSASTFIGGFVLGGIVVGTLSCVFAPQISKALAGADKNDLMRKLPKFIYDEENAMEKTRKVLEEKIAQLNSTIDNVSAQLRSEDAPNGAAVDADELEAAV